VKKEQVAFLVGGLAFGFLFGFATYHVFWAMPGKESPAAAAPAPAGPAGPAAMSQGPPSTAPQAAGGAPMVAEINALKKKLQDDPDDLASATRLAHLYHDVGMWPQAIEFYARAIEIAPDDPDLLTDMGVCHQEIGEYGEALRLFERASAASPDHWQSLYNRAVVLGFRLRRYDDASRVLDRLAEVRPDLDVQALRQALDAERAKG
jgi:Flp pilus assembly protein TadD